MTTCPLRLTNPRSVMPGKPMPQLLRTTLRAAVGADEEPGRELVLPVGASYGGGHRAVRLGEAGQLVSAADLDAQRAGALFEEFLQAALRDGQGVQRVVAEGFEVQRQRAELEARHR